MAPSWALVVLFLASGFQAVSALPDDYCATNFTVSAYGQDYFRVSVIDGSCYCAGAGLVDTLRVRNGSWLTGATSITGNLAVTGTTTTGPVTASGTSSFGSVGLSSTLTVTGATTLAGVSAGSTSVTTLSVTTNAGGSIRDITLPPGSGWTAGGAPARVNTNAYLVNDPTSGLMIAGSGTTRTVSMYDRVIVNGNLTATGATTLGSLSVSSLAVSGGATVGGNVVISGTTTTGPITATGTSTFAAVSVTGNLDVGGTVSAPSLVNGGFNFVLGISDQSTRGNSGSSRALVKNTGSTLYVNYAGDFTGGTVVNSSLAVTGATSLRTLSAGATALAATTVASLSSTGTASVASTLTVSGSTTLADVTVGGYGTFSGAGASIKELTLPPGSWSTASRSNQYGYIINDASGYNTLMIVGSHPTGGSPRSVSLWDFLTVNGGLSVTGAATVGGNLAVTGTTTSGPITASGTSTFGGATVNGALSVTGTSTLAGVTAASLSLSTTLSVSGGTTLATLSAASTTVTALTVTTNAGASVRDITLPPGSGWTASGAPARSNANAYVVNDPSSYMMLVGSGTTTRIITMRDQVNVNGGLSVSGNASFAGLSLASMTMTGSLTVGGNLAVTGTTTSGPISATGTSTFAAATVTGTVTAATASAPSLINSGFNFVLGNADQSSRGNSGSSRALVKNTGATLYVNYANDFTGGTVVNSAMSVTGSSSLQGLTAGTSTLGATTVASATVTGTATVGSTLSVSGATTLSSSLNVAGYTTVSGVGASIKELSLPPGSWNTASRPYSSGYIINDVGSYNTLMILGSNQASGARQVSLWDFLTINGGLSVTQSASVSGNLGVSGTTSSGPITSSGTSSFAGISIGGALSVSGGATLNTLSANSASVTTLTVTTNAGASIRDITLPPGGGWAASGSPTRSNSNAYIVNDPGSVSVFQPMCMAFPFLLGLQTEFAKETITCFQL
eukprot:TRINITY_DN217_c0_g2_i14.p1 TRINITY_DN217_c0_g2~~TRINITY_DN217_c0_g2_i14.p1  ORF type:complete len:964 (+),score=306.47 TRINITY_DN217_c0_g2_i14:112-3003(+)